MSTKSPLNFQCGCGQVQAQLSPAGVSGGSHIQCYCKDCQASARHLGYDLPPHGGTELIQTTPDAITITNGVDQLAILRLSPNGLCRWYATCCNTPMFNTLQRKTLPFAGVVVHASESKSVDQAMGPIWGHAFTAAAPANSGAPTEDKKMARIGTKMLGRLISAYLSGRAGQNPFLTKDKEWITVPKVLTLEERKAATR
ncbi:MAG: DUF6151 family protein [Thalassovita sp.]